MKNLILLSLALIIPYSNAFTQSMNDLMYYPDGEKYLGDAQNILELNKELEDQGRVWRISPSMEDGSFTMVGFKLFTDEPLWVVTDDSTNIDDAIESFNYSTYKKETFELFTNRFEPFIENGTLTEEFILETIGQPNERTQYFDQDIEFNRWTYSDINTSFTFRNGVVIGYTQIDN